MTWKHRLSNIDPDLAVADCAECGPRTPIRFKPCDNMWRCRIRLRETRKNEPPRPTKSKWTNAPGITVAKKLELLAEQGGVCAICGEVPATPSMDHCHKTGKSRGVLCRYCNIGLGWFRDDPNRLAAAMRYLADHD